ncbi:hypothetical protein LTR37_012159 [Vermiconidia calcicola]|uniref:Uncharacterized protein n=1 Tax=Vermiconidia calcicola TaxID=1690605 RepID=A0ACC3N189_9PEZI|nr:hypothetical protein LTR37_012159 [Vermiconidia calcicola]
MQIQRIEEPSTWSCDLCCDDLAGGISTTLDSSKVCAPCVRRIFSTSMSSEAYFPPRWGGHALDIWDFRHVIDTIFLAQFQKKADEWTCPPNERIYCRRTDPPRRPEECATFLGRRTDSKKCRHTSDAEGKEAKIKHHCDPSVEQELRQRAFHGLKRSKDYQDCPNPKCQRRVELSDGCNCIQCPSCKIEFCYICGRKASEESGHWRPGSVCPKWNQPGAKNALFYDGEDQTDSDSDGDSVSESDDEGLNMQLEVLRPWEKPRESPAPARKGGLRSLAAVLGLRRTWDPEGNRTAPMRPPRSTVGSRRGAVQYGGEEARGYGSVRVRPRREKAKDRG